MLVSNPFLCTVYQFRQAVMQDYWMKFLKFKSDVRFLSSMLPSKLEPYKLYKLGWLPINHICIERRLILFKRILDGRAPDYLTETLL